MLFKALRVSLCVMSPADIRQQTIDKGFILDKKDQAEARRLIMKLSAEYDKLPSGLSIAGPVTGRDEHATAHGGFGDIYRAVHAGNTVALKCMRTNLRGDDLRQIRRVRPCLPSILPDPTISDRNFARRLWCGSVFNIDLSCPSLA
jgi:hypothetical protein